MIMNMMNQHSSVYMTWTIIITLLHSMNMISSALGQYTLGPRQPSTAVGVQLFQWKFTDIAKECTTFLGPNGYNYVQTSPVQQHSSLKTNGHHPWYVAYQPIGYKIGNRLGTKQDFIDMVSTCKAAGVDIVVDVVLNHMTGIGQSGDGGFGSEKQWTSRAFAESFPEVKYNASHFHDGLCNADITDYDVRDESLYNCRLLGLSDVNTGHPFVQESIVKFLNKLLGYGVIGFRTDAARYISWPDWNAILSKLNLNYHKQRPYIASEVYGAFGDGTYRNYQAFGRLLNFDYAWSVSKAFRNMDGKRVSDLPNILHTLPIQHRFSTSFIENHDLEREHGYVNQGTPSTVGHTSYQYKQAIAFNILYPYGHALIHSGYTFNAFDQSPPATASGLIASHSCHGPWICQHRWTDVYPLIQMRHHMGAASDHMPEIQQGPRENQIHWSVHGKGFVAINGNAWEEMKGYVYTGLPAGVYCNIVYAFVEKVKGDKGEMEKRCVKHANVYLDHGEEIQYRVYDDGKMLVKIGAHDTSRVVALHTGVQSRLN